MFQKKLFISLTSLVSGFISLKYGLEFVKTGWSFIFLNYFLFKSQNKRFTNFIKMIEMSKNETHVNERNQ